ncbi:MAG: histidine kinase [Sphingomonadales bacterium]|nr:histidine kinase [Sphingomonadales bacterium]MDE2569652.1 histidine kinase [Sphingomonadales bacterium]
MIRTTLTAVAALGGLVLTATPAAAQVSWGARVAVGAPGRAAYYGYDRGYRGGDRMRDFVCSGARAHQLEDKLRHEVGEGDIDRWQARRIHQAIDRTERDQRYACSGYGDRGDVRELASRYDRIEGWIANAEHRGGRWSRGW